MSAATIYSAMSGSGQLPAFKAMQISSPIPILAIPASTLTASTGYSEAAVGPLVLGGYAAVFAIGTIPISDKFLQASAVPSVQRRSELTGRLATLGNGQLTRWSLS